MHIGLGLTNYSSILDTHEIKTKTFKTQELEYQSIENEGIRNVYSNIMIQVSLNYYSQSTISTNFLILNSCYYLIIRTLLFM